jgi:SIR2-like domain
MSVEVPRDLRNLYKAGRLIAFVGSGISSSFKWSGGTTGVSWSELTEYAIKLIGYDDPQLARSRATDIQILEYFRLAKGGNVSELTNWLLRKMHPTDVELSRSRIHSALVELKSLKHVYTTNYDDFIERAYKLKGKKVNVVTDEASIVVEPCDAEVVKFHGDFNSPKHMVLTESDYERRYKFQTVLDSKFRADILGKAILFLGYSFRDPNVSYLFRTINDEFGPLPISSSGSRAYIIVSNPTDLEHRLFAARNIQVIPLVGLEKTSQIEAFLNELGI